MENIVSLKDIVVEFDGERILRTCLLIVIQIRRFIKAKRDIY